VADRWRHRSRIGPAYRHGDFGSVRVRSVILHFDAPGRLPPITFPTACSFPTTRSSWAPTVNNSRVSRRWRSHPAALIVAGRCRFGDDPATRRTIADIAASMPACRLRSGRRPLLPTQALDSDDCRIERDGGRANRAFRRVLDSLDAAGSEARNWSSTWRRFPTRSDLVAPVQRATSGWQPVHDG
jgi:hypothetical protein